MDDRCRRYDGPHAAPPSGPGVGPPVLSQSPTDRQLSSNSLRASGLTTGSSLLPIRWNRDTDVTISAIQALDPWLKDAQPRVWREGFLPQPVVRHTGERDASGALLDGYLTAFINISYVQRVHGCAEAFAILDHWFTALSRVGLHAGRLSVHGDLRPWQRPPVGGITLFIDCDHRGLGDLVLLWNLDNPHFMAVDLGSGVERLRWHLSGRSWSWAASGSCPATTTPGCSTPYEPSRCC